MSEVRKDDEQSAHDKHISETFTFAEPVADESLDAGAPVTETEPAAQVSEPEPAGEEQVAEDGADADVDDGEASEEGKKSGRPRGSTSARFKELLNQRNEAQQQNAAMEKRFQQLVAQQQAAQLAAQQQQAPVGEAAPDFDEDPAGHILAEQQKLRADIDRQNQALHQQAQAQSHANQVHALTTNFNAAEQVFAAEHTDYFPRIEQLKSDRVDMWMGTGLTQYQAVERVKTEAIQIIAQATSAGQNPAEAFYRIAPASVGAMGQQQQASAKPRGSSLGTRGTGSSSDAPLTLAALADLPDDEFDRLTDGENWFEMHQKERLV